MCDVRRGMRTEQVSHAHGAMSFCMSMPRVCGLQLLTSSGSMRPGACSSGPARRARAALSSRPTPAPALRRSGQMHLGPATSVMFALRYVSARPRHLPRTTPRRAMANVGPGQEPAENHGSVLVLTHHTQNRSCSDAEWPCRVRRCTARRSRPTEFTNSGIGASPNSPGACIQ